MDVLRKFYQLCLIALCLPFVMAGFSVAVVALSDLAHGQPGMVSDPIILAVIAMGGVFMVPGCRAVRAFVKLPNY